ncbi:hypothetical protein EYR40_005698 [Pleurotus pulmonarius]|nr:hypothetical protein EYR40_005698 [Pleurotus pulmonarius]
MPSPVIRSSDTTDGGGFWQDDPPTPSSAIFSHHTSTYSRRSSIRPLPVPPAPIQNSAPNSTLEIDAPGTDRSSVESIAPVGISAVASPPDYRDPDPREEVSRNGSQPSSSASSAVGKDESPFNRPVSSSQQNPFSSAYEAPSWALIVLHVGLCLIAYPALMIFVLIAKDRTIFWTRFAVSCGCGIVGFCLGLSLLNLARAFLEAATWATLIHQSRLPEAPGLTLREFAAASQGTSALVAARVLLNRIMFQGTARKQRKAYDSRPWSLYVVYFLLLVLLAASLPFILGRLVEISTRITVLRTQNQHIDYREVALKGDLSAIDLTRATELLPVFEHPILGWTLSHYQHGQPPQAFSYPWGTDMVYFAETTPSQLKPNGSGFGVFVHTPQNHTNNDASSTPASSNDIDAGTTLRIPKSGLNLTYLFAPRETMMDLFASFSLRFPTILDKPVNLTTAIKPNDTLPFDVDPNLLTLGGEDLPFTIYYSSPLSMGEDGGGFISLEFVLVRLNTAFTPQGKFPVLSNDTISNADGTESRIGYDAALCLELFEPWVVEAYNSSTGITASTRIINKASTTTDSLSGESNIGTTISGIKRQLNSSALWPAYVVAHQNSVNKLVKDNSRDAPYMPSPVVVSYSTGVGANGFTELAESAFMQTRLQMDATNLLPYLAGTGDIVGRSYPDSVLSTARILTVPMVVVLVLVLLFGVLAGIFVPKLPLGVPRRDFELYSWVAAFHGDEVTTEMQRAGVERNMELREIEKRLGDMKFRYVF